MTHSFSELANPGILKLTPYVPGKPIRELQRELALEHVIKLASNENPLGASPKAIKAASEAITTIHLYPDPNGYELKQALAKKLDGNMEHIILGAGSDNVLALIARGFLHPGKEVIISQYAFASYEIITHVLGGKAVKIPAKLWGHDLTAMAKAITPNTQLIYLANPNNPTGTWFNENKLKDFLTKVPPSVLVVLDEAYFEYMQNHASYPNALRLQPQFPNLIITRTFSKAYGLAGLRVGYGIAHPVIVNILNRTRSPFNVSSPALAAAVAALGDEQHLQKSLQCNNQGLKQLKTWFDDQHIEYISQVGNFVTVDFGQQASEIYQALLQQGIILRPLNNYGLANHLRITSGTESENNQLITQLSYVLNL